MHFIFSELGALNHVSLSLMVSAQGNGYSCLKFQLFAIDFLCSDHGLNYLIGGNCGFVLIVANAHTLFAVFLRTLYDGYFFLQNLNS